MSSAYEILRNRNFRLLVTGRFCVTLALQLQAVVVGWQVYEIKKDPLYLGLIGLTEAVPAISLALFGGHVVDNGQPLKIYRRMLAIGMLASFILLLSAGGYLDRWGHGPDLQLGVIFGVVFLSGVIRAFMWPAVYSLTPQIVERRLFTTAQTWISANFQIAAISGPAIGGMIYAWAGARAAYIVICCLIAVGVVCSRLLSLPSVDRSRGGAAPEPFVRSVMTGVRFVFANQLVLGSMALDMFAVLFGGATALLPIFAAEILMSGPESLGVLRAAPAVGALLMSTLMIHRPLGRSAGALLLWVVAGFGVCMIGFGLSRTLWLSVLFLGLSGAFDAVSVVIRHTIVQLSTPDAMRGRVSAVNMIFIGSSNEIGEFESGVAAKLLGAVRAVVFGGCMTLAVVAGAAAFAPKLRRLEFEDPIQKK